MAGDLCAPRRVSRPVAALGQLPPFACLLSCTRAWRVCRRRAHRCPGSPGLGEPEALGSPVTSCTSPRALKGPMLGLPACAHSSLQAPGSPGGSGWYKGGSRHHSPGLGLGSWARLSPLPP